MPFGPWRFIKHIVAPVVCGSNHDLITHSIRASSVTAIEPARGATSSIQGLPIMPLSRVKSTCCRFFKAGCDSVLHLTSQPPPLSAETASATPISCRRHWFSAILMASRTAYVVNRNSFKETHRIRPPPFHNGSLKHKHSHQTNKTTSGNLQR